jgi:hypothetical protein
VQRLFGGAPQSRDPQSTKRGLRIGVWHATFRQVPYDHEAMAALARHNGQAELASALATGWIRSA